MKTRFNLSYPLARRIFIGVVGTTVLLVGIVLIVLPGPAFVVIPLGLGILGVEFAWARRWLRTVRRKMAGADGAQRSRVAATGNRPDR